MTGNKNPSAVSTNPATGVSYPLPDSGDDSAAIKEFLDRNSGKPVVVVQGLGFVGGVMSLVCANALTTEYAVIGVDLPTPQAYCGQRTMRRSIDI